MSNNGKNRMGRLLTLSALATLGVLTWRWAQRQDQRSGAQRDVSRWEGEGGTAADTAANAAAATSAAEAGSATSPQRNGAAGAPWPFPHGNA
jgi:hypothetical protein